MTMDTNQGPVTAERGQLFLTPKEVAEKLGLTTAELLQLRKAGQGPRYVAFTPRSVLYFASSVAESSSTTS